MNVRIAVKSTGPKETEAVGEALGAHLGVGDLVVLTGDRKSVV